MKSIYMQPSIPPIGRLGHFLRHKFTYPANHSDCKTVVNIVNRIVNDIHNADNYHCGVRSKARLCKLVM